eukprot:1187000-Prorocentrum_minimum.AAC.4
MIKLRAQRGTRNGSPREGGREEGGGRRDAGHTGHRGLRSAGSLQVFFIQIACWCKRTQFYDLTNGAHAPGAWRCALAPRSNLYEKYLKAAC